MTLLSLLLLSAIAQSAAPIDSVDRYVGRGAGPPADPRPFHRGAARRQRAPGARLRLRERRARCAGDRQHHLSVGVGREAVHRGRGGDAVPGWPARARRPDHEVSAGRWRGLAGHHHSAPAHAHVRHTRLRRQHAGLPAPVQRAGPGSPRHHPPAPVPAGRALELQQHRLPPPRRRDPKGDGEVLRRLPARPDLRADGHAHRAPDQRVGHRAPSGGGVRAGGWASYRTSPGSPPSSTPRPMDRSISRCGIWPRGRLP